ncbi:hypothetical protein ACHAW6_003808 [Cyclotella cf. meneghiniana]
MFESLTQSMKARLRSTVGEMYWNRALEYLDHFEKKIKSKERGGQPFPDQLSSERVAPGQQLHAPTTSSSNFPPGSTATTAQPPARHQMNQTQAPEVMKMPLQGARTLVTGSNAQIPASSTAVVPPSSTTSAPPPTAAEASAKKRKDDEEKRVERNAANRARRAHLKKKKEEEQQKLLLGKLASGGSNVSIAPSLIAPADPLAAAGLLSPTPIATTTLSTIGGSSVSTTASTGSKKAKDSIKTKKTVKKSSSLSTVNSIKKAIPSVREYEDHMECLDHAVLIDVKSLPNLLSKQYMSDVHLNEEQRNLLYSDKSRREKVKEITYASEKVLSSDTVELNLKEAGVPPLPWSLPSIYGGWGEKNVVSIRTAWAKVRLPESEMQMKERKKELEENTREQSIGAPLSSTSDFLPESSSPASPTTCSVATQGPPSTSLVAPENETTHKQSSMLKIEDDTTNHVWFNEARASKDPTLALLSEATERYLKSAIEKAIGKARLRQNLDGVRLWNTLLSRASDTKIGTITAPPPALIRLGCDVRRQIALAEGNAAKIYQRMEEAISRRTDTYYSNSTSLDPDTMILESASMAELSRKPPLKSAVENADFHAKRKFEISGGKHSGEPPLGRVPKQAKVTLQDMAVGLHVNRLPTNRARSMTMIASLFS